MEPPWFYCQELQPGLVELSESEAVHALRSRRLGWGDRITLFNGRGQLGHGVIMPAERAATAGGGRRVARASIHVEHVERVQPVARRLTLIVAACKGERLQWLVEKCSELGVTRIVFADFEHSVVHLAERSIPKLARTAIEACKQCGRAHLPELRAGLSLCSALEASRPAAMLVANPGPQSCALGAWVQENRDACDLAAVVGPEGGLSEPELARLAAAGAVLLRLAPHTLRVETAAVAVAAAWAAAT